MAPQFFSPSIGCRLSGGTPPRPDFKSLGSNPVSNERWLGKIQGDPRLRELVLPGSHDAGVYAESVFTVNSPKSWARCQGSNIYNQAIHGSRMFDCRVFWEATENGFIAIANPPRLDG